MKVISREQAQAAGLNRYFTGAPCRHGHVCERRTINQSCINCIKIETKKRYERIRDNPDYVAANRAKARFWAIQNPERYKERQRKYREANRDALSSYGKEWRLQNAQELKDSRAAQRKAYPERFRAEYKRRSAKSDFQEKVTQQTRKWRKANPEKYKQQIARWKAAHPERAKEISITGWTNRRARAKSAGKISADDIKAVRKLRKCAGCGIAKGRMEIDHIVPLSKGGTNARRNLQLLCRPCNRSKNAKDPIAWAQQNGRLL